MAYRGQSINLVPLGWLSVWPAWRVARGIFAYQAGSIWSSFVSSLLPRALWSANRQATIEKANCYLATKAGELVGVTGLYTLVGQPTEIWVGWYGVDAKIRGQGIGREILHLTIDLARKDGYETLRLWTTDNPDLTSAANRLYKELGFVPEATDLTYHDHPVLICSRALNGGRPSPCRASMPKALVGADFRKVQRKTSSAGVGSRA